MRSKLTGTGDTTVRRTQTSGCREILTVFGLVNCRHPVRSVIEQLRSPRWTVLCSPSRPGTTAEVHSTKVVPRVANWRLSSLPKTLEPEHVRLLLESCDQSTALGARNFAILAVLVRLGLRASEVANLELDDIDWRSGEFVVRGTVPGPIVFLCPSTLVKQSSTGWNSARPQYADPNVFIRMLAR